MEPATRTVMVFRSTVTEVGHTHPEQGLDDGFRLDLIPVVFFVNNHGLEVGDRVKITITKEPADA